MLMTDPAIASAAAGDISAQRCVVQGLLQRLQHLDRQGDLTPRVAWLPEMWARIAAVHPRARHEDLLRLADVLTYSARAADGWGEAGQAAVYRAEIISITAQLADSDASFADDAALRLQTVVASSTAAEAEIAQRMRRHKSSPAVIRTTELDASTRAMLAPAVERAGQAWGEIEAMLAAGHLMIWRLGSFCVTTEVDHEDVCNVRLGGGAGARHAIAPLEAAITAHPAHRGVRLYRIWGRKGWRRLFPHWNDRGVEEGLVVLERSA